ncbi:hypothetical protein NPE70_001077 [Salmonella enterica]|nr:hypothetical protein [Salmonella enterica]EJS2361689.1 hypothetical protein [Salmonella enterica]
MSKPDGEIKPGNSHGFFFRAKGILQSHPFFTITERPVWTNAFLLTRAFGTSFWKLESAISFPLLDSGDSYHEVSLQSDDRTYCSHRSTLQIKDLQLEFS